MFSESAKLHRRTIKAAVNHIHSLRRSCALVLVPKTSFYFEKRESHQSIDSARCRKRSTGMLVHADLRLSHSNCRFLPPHRSSDPRGSLFGCHRGTIRVDFMKNPKPNIFWSSKKWNILGKVSVFFRQAAIQVLLNMYEKTESCLTEKWPPS